MNDMLPSIEIGARLSTAIKWAKKHAPVSLYAIIIHPLDLMHLNYIKHEVEGLDPNRHITHIQDLVVVSDTNEVRPGLYKFLTKQEFDLNLANGAIERPDPKNNEK